MTFSKKYKTFNAWKKSRKQTGYVKRIVRLHKQNPKFNLKELRITRINTLDKKSWESLKPMQKIERINSLQVLSKIRHGNPLQKTLLEFGTTEQNVKKHVGNNINRKFDNIQRGMQIYTKGKISSIIIKNSRNASLIGKYFSTVRQALRTGDANILKKFKRIKITDISGKKHSLETSLEKLYEIEDSKENPEEFEIYDEEA